LRYAETSSLCVEFEVKDRFSSMASLLTEPSPSSSKRKLIRAGQIAFLPTGILTTLLGPMLPILIARWAMNDTQAGKLFLVQFLAQMVGVQLSALLLARRGYRPAFLSGLLLMAGGIVTLYLGSLWLGLASVAIYGLGLGLIIPTDNLLIAEVSAELELPLSDDPNATAGRASVSRASAVSLLNFFWGVGAVLCSLMVAWSEAHKLLPFFLGAVAVSLVGLAMTMRNLPFPPAAMHADSSSAPGAAPASASSSSLRALIESPAIWLFASVFFLYPGAETAVGGWIGSYVSRLSVHGEAIASFMPAFFWSALTVGRAFGTAFLHHFSERRVLRAGYAVGAAGIALTLWAPSLLAAGAGAMITGLSFATLYPITVARFSERFGPAARSIGALMFSLAALGPAVIPWLVGVISHETGNLRAGMLLPLGATLVLFFIHLFEW
jgi:FHS family glucose/mannose:H+ symporter-like MFS transporter